MFIYEFTVELTNDLRIKKFNGVSDEWFDFILQNRTVGGTQHFFDVVQGPVANDKTTRTISGFIEGIYTRAEAMQRLTYNKLNDQVSFHTEKAIRTLKLNNKRKIGKGRLTLNGQDLTLDIMFKIERIVTLLSEKRNCPFDDVYREFVLSKTYQTLQNTASMLWAESSEYIIDEYDKERQ